MSLNVLYVEDEAEPYELLKQSVVACNATTPASAQVILSHAPHPDAVATMLTHSLDLVLADVCFPGPSGQDENRLDDIIGIVEKWDSNSRRGRPLPIIALTGKGKDYIEFCVSRKAQLYDIWDKGGASPEYRAWRLSRLAAELPRFRPDALIQRLVSQMTTGATWHSHVVDMIHRYDSERTEADQVESAGEAVLYIADQLGVRELCADAWNATVVSESLIRATCKSTRGHARHVLNVFWMGYYLLHHPELAQWTKEVWERLVTERHGMGAVRTMSFMKH